MLNSSQHKPDALREGRKKFPNRISIKEIFTAKQKFVTGKNKP
jgi:hypothetical protein